jgi:hypothetical protein
MAYDHTKILHSVFPQPVPHAHEHSKRKLRKKFMFLFLEILDVNLVGNRAC